MVCRLLFAAALFMSAMGVPPALAYSLTGTKWPASTVTMQLQLGSTTGTLLDGAASWGAAAEDALNTWNSTLGTLKFNVVRDSTATRAQRNRLNNVFFSGDIYGEAWGSGVLAVTLTFSSGSTTAETDVLFNSRLSWNSYRGAQRSGTGGAIYDFHRVAMHEFGHVLGLDHPDEAGQTVSALMNSRISSLDTITSDDIAGAQSLYGASSATTSTAAPVITAQPASATVTVGQSASFTVGVNSAAGVSYQWSRNGEAIAGATAATYSIGSVTTAHAGNYTVVVANSAGSVTSNAATLTVNSSTTPPAPAAAPVFTVQPASQTALAGSSVTLSAAASGTPAPVYQWFRDNTALFGSNGPALTFTSVQPADAGSYRVVATNSAGSVSSSVAILTVNAPPGIGTVSRDQSISAGETLTLSVVATGTPAPAFQWLKDGVEIPGATAASYTVASASQGDAGVYTVRITNPAGAITSAGITVTVKSSRLANLSTRGLVPTGGALTPGFTVRGPGAKALVIRAVGPTLSLFGVGSALTEATLEVIAPDSTVIASNSNWSSSTAIDSAFARVGAFPLTAGSRDAAVQANLAPQAYTVRVSPTVSGASGVTLAEIYDADPATATTRLTNLSTLGFVGTGDNALTAGFVITGSAPKRLLVRAVGPGLAPFGVGNRLADPQLSLVPLGGLPLAANDDWPDLPSVQAAFTAAGAFALAPGSKDAALVITLEPGGYTVVVSGAGGTTGNALVEIYDLDP